MTAGFAPHRSPVAVRGREFMKRSGIMAALALGLPAVAGCSGGEPNAGQEAPPPVIVLEPDSGKISENDKQRQPRNDGQTTDRSANLAAADRYLAIFDRLDDEQNYRIREAYDAMSEDDSVAPAVLVAHRDTMELVRVASVGALPDWGIDLASEGVEAQLPQLLPMRPLGMLNAMALQQAIREARFEDALEYLATTLRLADHVQGVEDQRLAISLLVGLSLQSMATAPMAEAVGGMSPDQRREMIRILHRYGDIDPLSRVIHHERVAWSEWMINQLTHNPKRFREQLEGFDAVLSEDSEQGDSAVTLISLFDQDREAFVRQLRRTGELLGELASMIDQRYPEAMTQIRGFNERLQNEPLVAQLAIISGDFLVDAKTRAEIRQAMLEAAALWLNGDQAGFARIIDPAGDGPFTLEPDDTGGFTLHSVLKQRDGTQFFMMFPGSGPDN